MLSQQLRRARITLDAAIQREFAHMANSFPETIPAAFRADDAQEAYRCGWNHGHGIACHNVPTLGGTIHTESMGWVTVDAESIREVHADQCQAAADNSRQYSPFEFIAAEFNSNDEGGFRLSTAGHDTDLESVLHETREEAESEALEAGYALIREYVWEASGWCVQWEASMAVAQNPPPGCAEKACFLALLRLAGAEIIPQSSQAA
jgi:hypothetical protein